MTVVNLGTECLEKENVRLKKQAAVAQKQLKLRQRERETFEDQGDSCTFPFLCDLIIRSLKEFTDLRNSTNIPSQQHQRPRPSQPKPPTLLLSRRSEASSQSLTRRSSIVPPAPSRPISTTQVNKGKQRGKYFFSNI